MMSLQSGSFSGKKRHGSSVANVIFGDIHTKKENKHRSWNLAYLEVINHPVLHHQKISLMFTKQIRLDLQFNKKVLFKK